MQHDEKKHYTLRDRCLFVSIRDGGLPTGINDHRHYADVTVRYVTLYDTWFTLFSGASELMLASIETFTSVRGGAGWGGESCDVNSILFIYFFL
jgi:hypothetical protein